MSWLTNKCALTGLRWSLGLFLTYQCCRLLMAPAAAHAHLPHALVMAIAAVELVGAVLFLIPATVKVGGRILLATFAVAALVHILHGQFDVGFLVVYAMAVLTVVTG